MVLLNNLINYASDICLISPKLNYAY